MPLLSASSLRVGAAAVSRVYLGATEVWAPPAPAAITTYRGVNVFGGDAAAPAAYGTPAAFSNVNPGTYGSNYLYDRLESFAFYKSRGHRLMRLPFRLERLFSALNADGTVTVRTAERDRLLIVADSMATAGVVGMLEPHNYGAYWLSDGTQGVRRDVGSAEFTWTHWQNMYRAMVDMFGAKAGVLGFDLMNEPANMAPIEGASTFTNSRTLATFDVDVTGWSGGANTAITRVTTPTQAGAGALRATKTGIATGGYTSVQVYAPYVAVSDASAFGLTFSVWVQPPAGVWSARLDAETGGAAPRAQGSNIALTAGQWNRVTVNVTTAQAQDFRRLFIQFDSNSAPDATAVALVDTVEQGAYATTGGMSSEQRWEYAAQVAYDAIRDRETVLGLARKRVAIPLYEFSNAYRLHSVGSPMHPGGPWITKVTGEDRLLYTIHDYWHTRNGIQTYDQEVANCGAGRTPEGRTYAASGADDAYVVRCNAVLQAVSTWLGTEVGWIGEYGIYIDRPAAEVEQWSTLADKWLTTCDTLGLWATYWAAGEWWPNTASEFENVYINEPESGAMNTVNVAVAAAAIEAHPST